MNFQVIPLCVSVVVKILFGQLFTVQFHFFQLRKQSKASESGLREGDIVLCINGYSCRGFDHSTAMSQVDQAGSQLTLDVLR